MADRAKNEAEMFSNIKKLSKIEMFLKFFLATLVIAFIITAAYGFKACGDVGNSLDKIVEGQKHRQEICLKKCPPTTEIISVDVYNEHYTICECFDDDFNNNLKVILVKNEN